VRTQHPPDTPRHGTTTPSTARRASPLIGHATHSLVLPVSLAQGTRSVKQTQPEHSVTLALGKATPADLSEDFYFYSSSDADRNGPSGVLGYRTSQWESPCTASEHHREGWMRARRVIGSLYWAELYKLCFIMSAVRHLAKREGLRRSNANRVVHPALCEERGSSATRTLGTVTSPQARVTKPRSCGV